MIAYLTAYLAAYLAAGGDVRGKLTELVGTTAIYTVGTLLTQLVSFLLLPLYTRFLTPSDYGALSLLVVIQSVVAIVVELAVTSGVFRWYHGISDEAGRNRLLTTGLAIIATSAATFGLSLQLIAPALAPWILDFPEATPLFRIAVASGSLMPLAQLGLRTLQLDQRPRAYVAHAFIQFVFTAILTVWLVAGARWGVAGVLIGHLAGVTAQGVASLARLAPRARAGADWALARRLWTFSLPLVPTNLAGIAIALADRFFLEKLASLHETGIYAVADKMVTVVQVLVIVPFSTAFTQFAFARQGDPDLPSTIARVFRLYCVVIAVVVVGYGLIIRELLAIATTAEFAGGYSLVPLLCAAPVAQGLIAILACGLHLSGRTAVTPVLFGAALATNVALNVLWIPAWGAWGAAAATAVTVLVNAFAYFFTSRAAFFVPYPWRDAAIALGAAASALGVYVWLDPPHLLPSLGLRVMCAAGFGAVLILAKVAPRHELVRLLELVKARLGLAGKTP